THYVADLERLRNFAWLRHWQDQGAQQANAEFGLFVSIGLPVLLCLIVQLTLRGHVFGLPSFVFALLVLAYCMGPRDLERDVEAVDKAPDSDARTSAAQALRPDESTGALAFASAPLVESVFIAALRRVFGVIFWFALLGPVGALLYRLAQLLAYTPEHHSTLPAAQQDLARNLARLLDWLPAHLIALASVDADVAAGDGHVVDVHEPLVALDDAMTLIRRVLIVWVALIALIVIGGW